MLPSDISKMAQTFSDIAEGKKKDDSYLETDMKKRRKNNEKAIEDMKKVKDDTVPRWMREKIELVVSESFYFKRLMVLDEDLAEAYLVIAAECILKGYESPRLIDNIAEAIDKDVVGHDFRSGLFAVNPRLHESRDAAEKRQARAIINEVTPAPKTDKRTDLGYRAGRALTNMGGDLVKGVGQSFSNMFQGKRDTPDNNPAAYRQQRRLNNIGNFLRTGQLPTNNSSTTRASTPQAQQQIDKNTKERQTNPDYFGTGAGNPTAQPRPAAPAAPARPAAPASPAPTAVSKPPAKTYNVGGTQMTKDAINKKYDSMRGDPGAAKIFGNTANQAIYGKNFAKPKTPNPQMSKFGGGPDMSAVRANAKAATLANKVTPAASKVTTGRRVREEVETIEEKKKGLWDNIHAKRKRGEKPAKPGDKDYPKTLDVESVSFYDCVVGYLMENEMIQTEDQALVIMEELTGEEIAFIVEAYTTKHGKKAMDWNRSDDKPKTVAKNPKMPKKKEGKCDCCGNDPCTC